MIYGGLQACSLIDFPGRVSCVLFLSGCNFACPYCHNPELASGRVPDGFQMDDGAVLRFLDARKGLLDGVVICGGEPTVQHGLENLCRDIKSMGFAVKLDTNGGRPAVLARLVEENLIDYIAMDVKTLPDHYPVYLGTETGGTAVVESIPVIIESGVGHEFRTTCVRPMVDAEAVERIAGLLKGADLYVLQKAREGRSLDPGFFDRKDRCIEESELVGFKRTAESLVKKCVIR
ncbi:MAG TPA: anaerobic ribonucleoside-triphosphate reductase activating protein [Desulfobacteraceae bacterium]|nr:anaerobic ribonucleoside-triphosphate reductase activating protein [Desulfobacteraceae bacterium]